MQNYYIRVSEEPLSLASLGLSTILASSLSFWRISSQDYRILVMAVMNNLCQISYGQPWPPVNNLKQPPIHRIFQVSTFICTYLFSKHLPICFFCCVYIMVIKKPPKAVWSPTFGKEWCPSCHLNVIINFCPPFPTFTSIKCPFRDNVNYVCEVFAMLIDDALFLFYKYLIQAVFQVFSAFGFVHKIATFEKAAGFQVIC